LRQLEEREEQINNALSNEESSLLSLVENLGDTSAALRTIDINASDRDEALRALADSFVVQGSPTNDRALQLLS
jgi:hypothetical protein